MIVPNNNPQVHKEHFTFFKFAFLEDVTIIDWISNMKLYVSSIGESYKDTIIVNLESSDVADLLLHILHCWHACAFDE